MCGIVGIWDPRILAHGTPQAELRARIERMNETLEHRGPDDHDTWLHPTAPLALAHRRLAIVDLSPTGRQPMASHDGRYVVTFNGEIFNYRELRSSLTSKGVSFQGTSDTEVLLEAVAAWGLRETLERANGMWAFAVHDQQRQTLTLVRDRLGIKPLYYSLRAGCLRFASELKAIKADMQALAEVPPIHRRAVADFMRYGYIPAPRTIYTEVCKLPAGSLIEFSAGDVKETPELRPDAYWSLTDHACQPRFDWTDEECLERYRAGLEDSITKRMVADVPLGAFLSGGIDSSLVVATMQASSNRQVKTFCIGFDEEVYDESPHAAAIARHLGTEHHQWKVSSREAQAVIPRLSHVYDEPFADSSQIPTILVSEMARKHVTVSLSGDGGDELFAGYSRYATFDQRWRTLRRLTRAGRSAAASILQVGAAVSPRWLSDKLRRRALGFGVHSPAQLYAIHNAHWKDAEDIVIGDRSDLLPQWHDPPCDLSPIESWMATDGACYLPDDILVKVDRASMSVGLEARVPLLDHRLVELAWRMPMRVKRRAEESKWLLRTLLAEHVPRALFERTKMGFGVPIGRWLRGPLRNWADDLLAVDRLRKQELLAPERIADIWSRHRSGRQNWEYMLWDVLMLQSWIDHQESTQ